MGTTVVTNSENKTMQTYGYDKNDAAYHTQNLKVVEGSYIFDLVHPGAF